MTMVKSDNCDDNAKNHATHCHQTFTTYHTTRVFNCRKYRLLEIVFIDTSLVVRASGVGCVKREPHLAC